MKNIILILLIACIGLGVQAQSTTRSTVTAPVAFTVFGNASDTIKKGSVTSVYDIYTIPVSPFAKSAMFEVKAVRTAGTYTKARFVLQKSAAGNYWENVDSVSFAGTGTTQINRIALKTDVYRPLLRIKAYGYDSTQVIKYQYTILIDK